MDRYERFTELGKQILTGAERRAATAHSPVGTDDLLIALRVAGDGHAFTVLDRLGVDMYRLRGAVALSQQFPDDDGGRTDIVATSSVWAVIQEAFTEAQRQGVDHVDTEHLLLGILRENQGVAARALEVLRVGIGDVWRELITLHPRLDSLPPPVQQPSRSSRAAPPSGGEQHPALATLSRVRGATAARMRVDMPVLKGRTLPFALTDLIDESLLRSVVVPHLRRSRAEADPLVWQLTAAPLTIAGVIASVEEWKSTLPPQREEVPDLGDEAYLVSEGHGLLVRRGFVTLHLTVFGVVDAVRALTEIARDALRRLPPEVPDGGVPGDVLEQEERDEAAG